MAVFFRRRVNKGKFMRRIISIFFLIVLFLNYDNICRIFYPFPHREAILYYAQAYDVDHLLLVAMAKAESSFDSRAVSEKGARGLMQIMPDTGQWIARQMDDSTFNPERLFEPETNIKYGTWYIADLQKEFHGNTVLVLAAYNGGRGNVSEWLTRKEISGGKNIIEQIPFPETRHYVRKVLLYHRIYSFLYR